MPIGTVFSGILLLNFFYWTTNQQIVQRTFGAKSLAEGQKGVLATGILKLIGPMYLVIPGMIAFAVFAYLVITMLVIGELKPSNAWWQEDAKALDLTPWRHSRICGLVLIGAVVAIYVVFADLSVLTGGS